MKSLIVLALFAAEIAFAQETAPAAPARPSAPASPAPVPVEAPTLKEDPRFFGLLTYSPLDLILPNKFGLTGGWITAPGYQNEIEYLRGSLSVPLVVTNLGGVTEERLSYVRRRFTGDSGFNFSYGVSYFKTVVHIGDSLMNRLAGGYYPSADLVDIQSLGANVGIGHRWLVRRRFVVSVDWLEWNQPLFNIKREVPFLDVATNSDDRSDVGRAVNAFAYFPRFTLLKLQIGYEF